MKFMPHKFQNFSLKLLEVFFLFFFSKVEKYKYLRHLLINHLNFYREYSNGISVSTNFVKINFDATTMKTSRTTPRRRSTVFGKFI